MPKHYNKCDYVFIEKYVHISALVESGRTISNVKYEIKNR